MTQLIMMKADVLSGFENLKVCTSYNYRGEEIQHLPFNIDAENVTPVYTHFKGWKEDLTRYTEAGDIPQELQEYITFIEMETGVPITVVSVGPDRKQTILR